MQIKQNGSWVMPPEGVQWKQDGVWMQGEIEWVQLGDVDFSGTSSGQFRYIGNYPYVILPDVLKGITLTNKNNLFENTRVRGVRLLSNITTSVEWMFSGVNVGSLDLTDFNTSNVTNFNRMFGNADINNIDLSQFDTSSATVYYQMFFGFKTDVVLDLNHFETANANGFGGMFQNARLGGLKVNSFDTSNAEYFQDMFYGTRHFDTGDIWALDLSSWDTSKVITMSNTFRDLVVADLDLSGWDTSAVTNMTYMFRGTKLDDGSGSLDVAHFDTSNVTNMSYMFNGVQAADISIGDWDTSKVTTMARMFSSFYTLDDLDLSSFSFENVWDMTYMFAYSNIGRLDMSGYDVTRDTTYHLNAFSGATIGTIYVRSQAEFDFFVANMRLNANTDYVIGKMQ